MSGGRTLDLVEVIVSLPFRLHAMDLCTNRQHGKMIFVLDIKTMDQSGGSLANLHDCPVCRQPGVADAPLALRSKYGHMVKKCLSQHDLTSGAQSKLSKGTIQGKVSLATDEVGKPKCSLYFSEVYNLCVPPSPGTQFHRKVLLNHARSTPSAASRQENNHQGKSSSIPQCRPSYPLLRTPSVQCEACSHTSSPAGILNSRTKVHKK